MPKPHTFVSHPVMAQDTYIDEMTIYNPSGKAIYDAPVTTSAIIKYALMGDYYIELPFSLLTPLDFPLGSYITYKGRKFEIMSEVYPDFDNKTGGYKYTLQFQAQQNHMKNFICFWLGGDNPEAVFHNTTDLASFGALIVANMNKALGGNNWQMGSVNVEHPETNKLVSFNGDTCWDALSSIAETFDVEWWTEENGSIVTLHFGKLNFGTPETFKRGEVVKSIPAKKGDDSEYGTRFYVFGSTRNLTKEYGQSEQGGVTNHVSEVRLRLPDGQQYIDARPGLTKNEIKEVVVFFDDIYPKNTETVTSVETIDRTIIEGQTDKAYVMVCNDTPFLPSDVIEGETLGAHFTSGDLIGWDFELALIDDNGDNIDPATWRPEDGFNKKFEIIAQVETSGESQQIIPNENMRPRGKDDDRGPDTFVLTGVKLPQQRIDEAEQELLEVGTSYAAKHSSDTTVYDCETNPVYCTHNEKNYEAGQAVRLMGPQFGIDGRLSRIQGYEKKLYNEYIATYTIGDNTPYSRLGSIESDVKASLYSQRIGIAENGAAIYLITRYDNTFPTDTNAYSARRAIWEFANKQAPDTFKGRMTFNAGAQFGPSYASGITGVGGFISEKGAGELESLFIRRFLEVPELRYNRVGISVGDDWSAPGAGVIESVDKEQKLVTLKLEEGEIGAVAVGDICMGIFHDFDPSNNATADSDDGRGNFSFSGFATVYFRITEVLGDRNERFRYELRPLSATFTKQIDPMESMTFVAYGSFTNPARQSSRYSTRTYQRYLRNVSDWEFTAENIAAQFGDLTNLSVFGIQMSGYSAYLDNIYLQGMISSLDKKALLDTRSKLFRLVGDNGVGVAFTPEAGWKQGKLYDPATGQFQKEFDIEQIDQTATEAQATANSADRKAQQAKDYIDNTLPGELSEINKRLDGVVENWFYPYTPSLYNEPAQTWIADGEQENHIGDTFTNTLPANFDPTDAGCWEQGSIGASYIDGIKTWDQIKIADSTRIRLKTPVGGIPKGAVLSVGEGYTMGYNPIASSGAVIASYVWSQSYTVGSDNPYMAFVIRKTDNAKITPAEYPQIHFTISSDETTNPDAGKSWRWVKEEDGTYKWTPIADSDAVKALQEAARAQDTADAKRRVFVVTPTTPYDVGDIWTQGEGGDIMRCIESRATGNFESSDWDKASKYTDDTAANEAKERLAAMSSDGTLSKEEKPAVRQQWSQIQKEYAKYQTDATSFGVSITALKGAYDALAAYLSNISLTSDTDTTIVPDTFNQKFADYYAEVSRFSNLVAQKQADEAVDNLQVGARNYIAKQFIREWNSAKEGVSDVVTTGTDTDGAYMRIDANKASNAGVAIASTSAIATWEDCFGGKIAYKAGMSYVFKARIKQPNSARGVIFCAVYDDNSYQYMSAPPSPTASELYEAIYTTQAGKSLQKIVLYVVAWNPIYLYDIQLTEGNKAPTGYITAEEDVQAQIEQAQEAIKTVEQITEDTKSDVSALKNFTDEAFTDGVISRAEATSIEKYTNSVEETQKSADASYTTVYNNPLLSGTAKSNLQAAKSAFDTAVADLLAAIRTASDDGIATPEEKAGVDSQYALFNDAYSAFCTRLEEANEYIQTAINTAAQGAYQLSQELQGVVNNINETILPDLQDQIDKSIISWGGEEVPTLDNYPASEWTTDTERKRHINDGYDRKITTDGEVSYESYKFVFENGVYQWNRIADSGSATAIAEARKALGLAGTKARVFYGSATPSVPYEVNDVWFRTSGSGSSLTTTLYISNADKGDGETASADDWQLVDDSQVRLRQMSSDLVISREEKAVLRNTLAQMQKEFAAYQSDADTYGISMTALSTAYNALVNFLTGTVAVNNDTDTTLTQSQRTDYNTRFAAYTSEAARFSNLIADAISQGKVDGLQFGARNYIAKQFIREWNSAKEGVSDVVTTGTDTDGAYMRIDANKASNAGVAIASTSAIATWEDCFGGKIAYKAGMSYVFKARIKQPNSARGVIFCAVYDDNSYQYMSAPPSPTASELYEAIYTTQAGKSLQKIVLYVVAWNPIYLYDIQLTEGNKAPTGYITAEEDVQAQIEQVKLDVDYIASDSSLTPSDKQQVANEWARIQGEYWSIMANAEKYDVPTDSFTVYFQALEDYLTPLLADMSTTSEITGTEFRKVFSDYYEISSNMSDLIDDAIDESIKSTEYLKKAMEDGSTEVKGGLIMTNVMLLKNAEGDVTAGVSGLQEDDVPFWSGADYTNRKKAVFRVHADGEVHATKGTVGILQVKNDSVEVSDAAASGDKIILTPYRITSISQVLGAVSVPGVIETKEVSALATGQSNPFVRNVYESSPPFTCGQGVQMSARITARITGNAEGGGGGVKIEVVNALTGKANPLYRNSTAGAQNTNLNIDETISYLFTGAAQKYYIRITVEASAAGKLTASATMNAAQFNFVKDIRKNLIAPNGVAVVKGSSNYAVFTGDIFEVLIGKAGLRIQNGYVYKRDTYHTTWTKI